ncbi:type III restriction enzyme, Res subunit [Oceanococcus atlanticus]|uniref:Type III restriction enzyme, Res subunit n=1 Tax=Oceanococcus atlanticus TaxID=1317117 RepID=A0A1Y1SGH4_9GAMM|nr:DEAD/DEAH box helicase family protein [Oceanococcus atlanticus]ORE88765.1 type III restriction enzyme, Res subunit [Oceanococcus atlanticus]
MSNFQFLRAEFKPLFEPAKSAEQLVYSDPRACCMRARHALEQAVHWLYDNDRDLRMPYDRSLNVLLTQPDFEGLMPPPVYTKARLIQKFGNQAVHSARPVVPLDAMKLVRELFHILFWLARTYTRASDPKSIEARFDDKAVPRLVRSDEAIALTRDELKKQEAKFAGQIDEQHKELEKREAAIAEAAATIEAREAALAEMDAELAALRGELAKAKAANIAVPDDHDYNEADTRKLIIDVLLREAGWVVGETAGEEVPVTGMPNQHGEGFADYVLWGADGKPLAVVEAKRTTKDPEMGQQQAKLYADCLEQMKGQRPLIFYTNGFATWLWDDRRAPPREVQGFYTRDELELAITRRGLRTELSSIDVNPNIAGRSYQKRAIVSIAESLNQGRRRGLLAMATGTGKTRTAIALVDVLMRANWAKRVLFLADRVALVNQATKAFKAHLPDSSPVNLVTEKTGQGRVYLSTYPTMMGLIDQMKDGQRPFGVGHFDLVIIDEAHRSVYQKYGAIFRYFDSYLIGLTATPRDEVDRDTYHLFGLETGVPTDAYSLDEAVADGYLVPPKASSVPIKFVREGIKYDELSDEEKEHWESLDWGDRDGDGVDDPAPSEIHASQINKQLYNEHTVDLMLQHLMENGLSVEGGDKLGKTIIFAANQAHADFIAKRFNHHYPHTNGEFARTITYSVNYAQSLIDDFSNPEKLPQIAISVDMLDTGIDVPEVLNLVFFKAVRSKVKFLQMIGRGTRLCPDLFGPGQDKTEFQIFDFCGNFEYFNEHPGGMAGSVGEPLAKKLFKRRLELLEVLPAPVINEARECPPDEEALIELRIGVTDELHREVAAMNPDNFIVRPHREPVSRFAERKAWDALDDTALIDLRDEVAGLPSERETEHITAKLFDLTCLQMQLAVAQGSAFEKLRQKVMKLAADLETKDSIPLVKAQLPLIQDLQTDEYWQDISLPMLEHLRRKLRGLILFVDKSAIKPVYTVLTDEKGEASEVELGDFSTGINVAQYKRKVEAYIRANENHVAIAKLKHNKPLTPQDLDELERFVYESGEAESRERFTEVYGADKPLTELIRSLVGLDRNAAKEAFSQFLDGNRYSSQQIRFVEMIIERLTQHGVMDPGLLYEPPFTSIHHEGLDGVFPGAGGDTVLGAIEQINENARVA